MIEALETLVKTCSVWNEQQKTQVLAWLECVKNFGENLDRCSEKLEEAKKIIREYMNWADWKGSNCPSFAGICIKAEAFMKESENA